MAGPKDNIDPLPYIIVFAILFIIALGVFTWFLGIFYKDHACTLYPNIWCSDNWTCTTSCTGSVNPQGKPVSVCFASIGSTGLASCLYGPNAPGATVCLTAPPLGPPTGGTGLACSCPTGMSNSSVLNCFNGCAINLASVGQTGACCCSDPSNPKCAVGPDGKGTGICSTIT